MKIFYTEKINLAVQSSVQSPTENLNFLSLDNQWIAYKL